MPEMKHCPYCAEEIRQEAVRCRYCRSRLGPQATYDWHRDHREARVAGVAAALAGAFAVPLSGVRLGFVVLTFFHFLGPLIYAVLWLIIPNRADGESLLEYIAKEVLDFARNLRFHDDRGRRSEAEPNSDPPSV